MSATTCNHCTAEVTNGLALCQRCQHTLSVSLVNIASYAADVAAIQPGERIKAKSAYRSTPPPGTEPVRDRISDELNHVGAIIVGWCRNLADDRPVDAPPRETGLQCAWLEQHVASIATLEWAHECLREVMDCERRLKRVLNKADTGKYAGICGAFVGTETNGDAVHCPRELFLVADATWVRCPECGTQHDAAQRREVMKAEAREELVPVRVLAQVIVGLEDKQVSVEQLTRRVENWIARPKDNPRLASRGTKVIDGRPRKVYRIGDVLDLLEDDTRRNQRDEVAA